MPSPCDLVQDALTVADAIATGIAQNVPSDNSLAIRDDSAFAVLVHANDALTISDAVMEMWTQQVLDALTIGDAAQQHLVAHDELRDDLRIRDAVRIALSELVSDAVTIGDATSVALAQTVSDSLVIGDGVQLYTVATQLLRDSLRIGDAVQTGFAALVADALTITDAIDQRQSLVDLVADHLTIGDAAAVAGVVAELVADALTIADALQQTLSTSSLVADVLVIEDRASGGAPGAWTAHTEPFAMSRYAGFGFNSLAEVGGFLLMAGEGGLFVAGGADDAGAQIAAQIEHDLTDDVPGERGEMQSDPHHKRPRYLYAAYHSNGQLAIELGYMDQNDALDGWIERRVTESMPAMNAANFRTGRVPLSRGVRSRYLRPILKNVSGASFSMNEAYLQVDSIKRKV